MNSQELRNNLAAIAKQSELAVARAAVAVDDDALINQVVRSDTVRELIRPVVLAHLSGQIADLARRIRTAKDADAAARRERAAGQ